MNQKTLLNIFLYCAFAFPLLGADRIVSLLPNHTDIVEALGAGDRVVGVTVFDRNQTSEQKARTRVGDFVTPSLETIISLKPDLVLAGEWKDTRFLKRLKAHGIAVCATKHPRTLSGLYDTIRELGHVVSREKQADDLVAQLEQKVRFVEHERASEPMLSYYIEVDHPNWTLGNQDFLVDSLKRLRLQNIFSDVQQMSAQVSNELIVERKPDLIFSFREGRHDFRTRPGWQSVPAVVNHHIYDQLNGDNCSRPGPYLIDCLQEIVKVIHEK